MFNLKLKTMRKFITVCLLFVGLTMFSQDDQTLIDKSKEVLSEYVDTDIALSKINDIEQLLVHYFKEAAEGSKSLVGSGIEVAEKAVDLLYEQSTIIVKQFIIYTSISYAIPIIFGLFLIFKLPSIIKKRFSMDTDTAIAHNDSIDMSDIYKPNKKLSYLGAYYRDGFTLLSANVGVYIGYVIGGYFVIVNIMPFIKVTLFSKLYLVEMLLKYI